MDLAYESQAVGGKRVVWSSTRIFLLLAGTLTSTVGLELPGGVSILRVSNIQYLEIIYFFQLVLLVILFPRQRYRTHLLRPVAMLGVLYAIFTLAAFILALWALGNDFYLPSQLSFLKHPFWISVSRMTELIIDVAIMMYLIQLFRTDKKNLVFTLRVYFAVGLASALYSIFTFPLQYLFHVNLGTYLVSHRMRGFYNEGGPYGLYALSVVLVGIILLRQRWANPVRIWLAYIPIGIALLDSQSKAALVGVGLILGLNALMVKRTWARVGMIFVLLLISMAVSFVPTITEGLKVYIQGPQKYEYLSNLEDDLLSGRIAGAFIVRRMIAVHPWAGIGWANYPLVRNSPEYRGAARWADFADDPGLGMLGTTADFGIPLTVFLLGTMLYPYFYLRRRGAPLAIRNLALLQPVVHLCGAQLSLTYPWLITAFALGLGHYYTRHELEPWAPSPGLEGSAQPSLPAPRSDLPLIDSINERPLPG